MLSGYYGLIPKSRMIVNASVLFPPTLWKDPVVGLHVQLRRQWKLQLDVPTSMVTVGITPQAESVVSLVNGCTQFSLWIALVNEISKGC